MKIVIAGLFLASTFAAGTANAQYAPFNEAGVTMGHWHLASKDAEANKKIFLGMGGQQVPGNAQSVLFPGMRINLTLGNMPGNGGSRGSVVNHVGFIVNNVQERVAQWKANGVAVLPGGNNRLVVDIPGAQIRFAKADTKQAPTKGRVLDHFGVDVKDHPAFVRKIESEGIKLDEPPRKNEATGVIITYITDPWDARIEIVQRAPEPPTR